MFSNDAFGQSKVMGSTDESFTFKAHICADAERWTAGLILFT